MTTATQPQSDALVERLLGAAIGTLELAAVHIGDRLGFYRSLDEDGPATPADLAAATGTAECCGRDWLEQQAVAGILSVADPGAQPDRRRYGLPAAHRALVMEPQQLDSLGLLVRAAIEAIMPIDAMLAAYRIGGAVRHVAGPPVAIGDGRIADRFTAPGDDIDRFVYGWRAVSAHVHPHP